MDKVSKILNHFRLIHVQKIPGRIFWGEKTQENTESGFAAVLVTLDEEGKPEHIQASTSVYSQIQYQSQYETHCHLNFE